MTIETFADEVITLLQERFPNVFGTAEFQISRVNKPGNVILTGISIRLNNAVEIAPVYYVNGFMENGKTAWDMASDIAGRIENDTSAAAPIGSEFITNWALVKENIVPRLISSYGERNADYLKNRVKERLTPGIVVIYDITIPNITEGALASIAVTKDLMHMWEVSPQQIHEVAIQNGHRIRPIKFDSLANIMAEMLGLPFVPDAPDLDVLSNIYSQFGAAVILYPGVKDMLDEKYGPQGYYILTASVHELLIAPKTNTLPVDALWEMVMQVNDTEVSAEDFLADDVLEFENDHLVSAIKGGLSK